MIFVHDTPTNRLLNMVLGGGSPVAEYTATGNPLTFVTDLARPLKSLLIPFIPVQSGTGDPSPQNIRSIIPWDGLTVGQINGIAPDISNNSGMEKVNGQWQNSITDTKTRFDAYIQLFKGSTYIKGAGFKAIAEAGIYSMTFVVDDENCNRIIFLHSGSRDNLSIKFPFELPQGTYTISFNVVSANPSTVGGLAIKDIFLIAGGDVQRTETDISFPSPVYGGTLDVVSGVLRVQWAGFIATWGDGDSATDMGSGITRKVFPMVDYMQTGSANNMCNIAPYSANESANVHFYYSGSGSTNRKCRLFLPSDTPDSAEVTVITKLSQAYEVQLTPSQITALVGNNTIWSDANELLLATFFKKK